MITPEQLEMLKRLKPAIDKYMGEYLDKYMEVRCGRFSGINILADCGHQCPNRLISECKDLLLIPPFCTPDGKRCLTKMLTDKGKEYLYEYYHTSITILLRSNDYYTAILKALVVQEGV
jgi:hypothetical protein